MLKRESDDILEEATSLCQDERELEAEALVNDQLTKDPDNLDLMTKLGVIQARLCNDHEAESTFRAVLVRNPNHEDAVCGLGRLLDQSLRIEEAEKVYREFLSSNPVGHCATDDLCRLLLSENRVDEALELARNQVENYRDSYAAFDALRYVLHILEDQLESDLNDDRDNVVIFTQLANNLFEQLELAINLENMDGIPGEYKTELLDDKTRLVSELESLLDSASSRQFIIPEDLQEQFSRFRNREL